VDSGLRGDRVLNLTLEIYCDGSGTGGYGWTAQSASGNIIKEHWGKIQGDTTNNVAEYEAVISALKWALENTVGNVFVYTDSLLVVSQVSGTWRCKKPHLQPLLKQARELMARTDAKLAWIPRKQNKRADELSHGWENGGENGHTG